MLDRARQPVCQYTTTATAAATATATATTTTTTIHMKTWRQRWVSEEGKPLYFQKHAILCTKLHGDCWQQHTHDNSTFWRAPPTQFPPRQAPDHTIRNLQSWILIQPTTQGSKWRFSSSEKKVIKTSESTKATTWCHKSSGGMHQEKPAKITGWWNKQIYKL